MKNKIVSGSECLQFFNRGLIVFLLISFFIFNCTQNINSSAQCHTPIRSNEIRRSSRDSDGARATVRPTPVSPEDLVTGRSIPTASRRDDPLPFWMNLTLARRGQRFARRNLLGGFFAAIFGLIASIAIPDNRDILLFTSNSDSANDVLRRYSATIAQTLVWYRDDIKLDPHNNAFLTSISNVRQFHTNVAKRANAHSRGIHSHIINPAKYKNIKIDEELWTAFEADLAASNIPKHMRQYSPNYFKYDKTAVPINQFTHATTQFAFFGHLLVNPPSLFVYGASEEDLNGMVHLWAIIGYAMGIEDEYNICLQPNLMSAQNYFRQVENQYYIPTLFNLDHTSKVLIEALVLGYNDYVPGVSGRLVLFRYLRDIIRIPVYNMASILSISDHLAQLAFDYKFVPGTRVRNFASFTESTINSAFEGFVTVLFGPYFTNMELARNVFYNGTAGFTFQDETCPS